MHVLYSIVETKQDFYAENHQVVDIGCSSVRMNHHHMYMRRWCCSRVQEPYRYATRLLCSVMEKFQKEQRETRKESSLSSIDPFYKAVEGVTALDEEGTLLYLCCLRPGLQ